MQCSHCGKSDWVTIGNQSYCTHCGNPQAAAAGTPDATSPASMPPETNKTISDVRAVRAPNHASGVHAGPASASPAVLDLRAVVKPAPQNTPPLAAAPVAAPAAPEPIPEPEPQVTSPTTASAGVAVAPPAPTEATPQERLARAAAVNKSDMIKRFVKPAAPSTETPLTLPAAAPQPAPLPEPIVPPELPALAATQIDSLKNQIPASQPTEHHKPSPAAVLATTVAIAAMGIFIWVNNVGNLTITAAAQKAGIKATMPSYVPSSYSLSGPVSYGPGYLTMQFKSPSNPGPLVLTERRTDWSAGSLLDLYVAPKAQDYVTVQTQGLTIYIYNGNQATWVNHGIQYVIEGSTHLSKEQVIKMAESL